MLEGKGNDEVREVYQWIEQIAENLNKVSNCNTRLEDAISRIGSPKRELEKIDGDADEGKVKEPANIIEKIQMLQNFSRVVSYRYERAVSGLDSLV